MFVCLLPPREKKKCNFRFYTQITFSNNFNMFLCTKFITLYKSKYDFGMCVRILVYWEEGIVINFKDRIYVILNSEDTEINITW